MSSREYSCCSALFSGLFFSRRRSEISEKYTIFIAGGGLSGLTSAFFLQRKLVDFVLVEKELDTGGLCRSSKKGGLIFDYTGHLLHFSRNDVYEFVKGLGIELLKKTRRAFISRSGKRIPYPFQANLAFLKREEAYKALLSFIQREEKKKFKNTEDYFKSSFGEVMYEYFFRPYNIKLWTKDPKELSMDWTGRFVPKVKLEEVLKPLFFRESKTRIGYNSEFFYPKKGIGELPKSIGAGLQSVKTGEEIVKILYKKKKIVTDKGQYKYEKMFYTLPLNRFSDIAYPPLSGTLKSAFDGLKHVSVTDVELAFKGNSPDFHWIYLPEKDFLPYRIGCSSNFYDAPKNKFSIYAEISSSEYKKLPSFGNKELAECIIHQLKNAGLVDVSSILENSLVREINPAYILYDFQRKKSLRMIFDFFGKNSIFPLGRYGRWEY
ncbi:FAD-dependent oxidoreductase, partial [candidate division WOR-3 bacterium]|nr:FAD-dependent oxidoreductase [candidate division WOR-3 bacterium]